MFLAQQLLLGQAKQVLLYLKPCVAFYQKLAI